MQTSNRKLLYILTDQNGCLFDVLNSDIVLSEVIKVYGQSIEIVNGQIVNLDPKQRDSSEYHYFRMCKELFAHVFLYTKCNPDENDPAISGDAFIVEMFT
jgi:predicted nucleotidyltransferase